ncbi:MAG: hypothetical protein IPH52_22750 [Leptospiraceae bacterium]|nr:hypothetical protein [Leptospiraceae bacterium]
MERVTPKDKALANLYFLWALSEQFSEDKERAISLYKKSASLKKKKKKKKRRLSYDQ